MSDPVESPVTSVPLGPIGERDRILALDVLRGFALLGIFFVNMPFFAGPFSELFGPIGGDDATSGEVAAWAFIEVFCEFKFISLFSLLFGMGLVVMLTRAKAAGRPFVSVYLRRIFVLALFGLAHVVFLWYGDILFMYAGCAVILLLLSVFSARAMLITALVMFVLAGLVVSGFGALNIVMVKTQEAAAVIEEAAVGADAVADADADTVADTVADTDTDTHTDADTDADADADTDADTDADAHTDADADADADAHTDADADAPAPFDPQALHEHPMETAIGVIVRDPAGFLFGETWADIERTAYGEGPFRTAAAVRIVTYGFVLIQVIFVLAWRIIAMFLIGAALMKLDFFAPHRRVWHRRMCAIGLLVGLPLEIMAFWLGSGAELGVSWAWLGAETIHYFASMALCFGYLGTVVLIVQSGRLSLVARGFAGVGRMALTNYILQSVAATYVMYWFGLGRFDTFLRPQMLALVVAIFAAQIILSAVWLKMFRMGPLEYVWRTLTYMRPPRLVRGGDAGDTR